MGLAVVSGGGEKALLHPINKAAAAFATLLRHLPAPPRPALGLLLTRARIASGSPAVPASSSATSSSTSASSSRILSWCSMSNRRGSARLKEADCAVPTAAADAQQRAVCCRRRAAVAAAASCAAPPSLLLYHPSAGPNPKQDNHLTHDGLLPRELLDGGGGGSSGPIAALVVTAGRDETLCRPVHSPAGCETGRRIDCIVSGFLYAIEGTERVRCQITDRGRACWVLNALYGRAEGLGSRWHVRESFTQSTFVCEGVGVAGWGFGLCVLSAAAGSTRQQPPRRRQSVPCPPRCGGATGQHQHPCNLQIARVLQRAVFKR